MKIKSLDQIAFSALVDCFLKAFENYFVKMPTDLEYYKERWGMAGIRLDLSYGMFDHGNLVGFIINAVDRRGGNMIAYNTGTGVLPEYRGKRIVDSMYQFAFPELRKNGITKCQLEVIKENTRALNVYRAIGFKITKSYKCFDGDITLKQMMDDFVLKKVSKDHFDWSAMKQSSYSWDNHFRSIEKGKFDYYIVLVDGVQDSYFAINPQNGYLAQFNVFNDSTDSWNRLFTAIKSISNYANIKNVDEKLTQKIDFLNALNLKNSIDQFEMELDL